MNLPCSIHLDVETVRTSPHRSSTTARQQWFSFPFFSFQLMVFFTLILPALQTYILASLLKTNLEWPFWHCPGSIYDYLILDHHKYDILGNFTHHVVLGNNRLVKTGELAERHPCLKIEHNIHRNSLFILRYLLKII